jgi:hypothetical protein
VPRRASFKCAHCSHYQRAEVRAVGYGAVTALTDEEYARERAQINACKNGDRLLRFATCPKCGKRGHRRAFVGRYALMFCAICAALFLLGLSWPVFDHSVGPDEAHIARTWGPLFVDACVALVIAWVAWAEWRGIDKRVRWLDFK